MVLVFDVMETLLDVSALDPLFQGLLGAAAVRKEWFSQMLQNAMSASLMGAYRPLGDMARSALDMTAQSQGKTLSEAGKKQILDAVSSLPAHPDVKDALNRLKGARFRMATLTNSAPQSLEAQLQHAGLSDFFEHKISVDEVKKYKPSPEPYHHAAKRIGVPNRDIRLIAAHAWDITGAMQVGCAAAFIMRPGKVLNPLAKTPDIVGPDLKAIAEAIAGKDKP